MLSAMNENSFDTLLANLLNELSDPTKIADEVHTRLEDIVKRCGQGLAEFNALLIQVQRPGAALTLSERQWAEYGRRPIPGIGAIVISVPFKPYEAVYEFKDTEPIPGFEGEVLQIPPSFEPLQVNEDPTPLVELLLARAHYLGIDAQSVKLGEFLGGDVRRMDRGTYVEKKAEHELHYKKIFYVRYAQDANPATLFRILVHEYAHVALGHLGPINPIKEPEWNVEERDRAYLPREIAEVEAEMVAYMVCGSHGVTTNAGRYLRGYIGDLLDELGHWPKNVAIQKATETAHRINSLLGPKSRIRGYKSILSKEPLGTGARIPEPTTESVEPGNQAPLFIKDDLAYSHWEQASGSF